MKKPGAKGPGLLYFMISSTMNALQFSDYRFQLLTQSDGIALREEYHSIEGIRDGEDRQQVLVLKLHVLYHFLAARAILVNTENDVLWQAREL